MNNYLTQIDMGDTEKKLSMNDWEGFYDYLIHDRKFKESTSNKAALKSRYKILCQNFSEMSFTRQNFTHFIKELKEKNYKTSYVNGFLTLAKNLDKYYNLNILRDYSYYPTKRPEFLDTLTPKEIADLAEVKVQYGKNYEALNKRQKAIIYLLGTTGCRIGEALNLRWSDLIGSPKAVQFIETKNNDTRIVPISDSLYNLIASLPRMGEYIFCSHRGGRLEPPQINLDLKVRSEAISLNKVVWCHLFRHSYITEMIRQGVSLSHISRIVGHHDIKSTNRYTQLVVDDLVEVIYYHPLLKAHQSYEAVVKRMKSYIDRNIDLRNATLQIEESANELVIRLKKL